LKKEAVLVRYAREAIDFANELLEEKVRKEKFLNIDPEHSHLKSELKTGEYAMAITYNPINFVLSFDPGYYLDNTLDYKIEDDLVRELVVANMVFHEYGHHIQSMIGKGFEENKAWVEDTADYISGYLLRKFVEKKNKQKETEIFFANIDEYFGEEHMFRTTLNTEFGNVFVGLPQGEYRSIRGHNKDKNRNQIIKKGYDEGGDDNNLKEFVLNYK